LAVELTSSNTKPVVQEFQSECYGPCWQPDAMAAQTIEKNLAYCSCYLVSWGRQDSWEPGFSKVLKNRPVSLPV